MFDIATVRGVIARKWWVVPVTMMIGLLFMFWQESDLQTSSRYFTLSRTYEPLDETSPLSVVDIDPSLLSPFPSEINQLIVLQSPEVRQQVSQEVGTEISVLITRSEPNFSLTSSAGEDGKQRFSFVSFGSSSYSFSCTETDRKNCDKAIDAYAERLVAIRAEATKAGLQRSIQLIDALLATNANISPNSSEKLVLQRAALEKSVELASGEMQLVSKFEEAGGEQIATVGATTYLFGLFVGFIIGCLILLQLIVSDGVIRSSRKLINVVGYSRFLGSIFAKEQKSSVQHLAAAIRGSTGTSETTSLRIVPIGAVADCAPIATDLSSILALQTMVANPIQSLSAEDLRPTPGSPVVFLVTKNSGRVSELEYAWTVVEKSGNTILGAALIG